MPAKIRLQRHGRKKKPFYHIVIADARAPRDGKFIEKIGTYNPMTSPATIELDRNKAFSWLMVGAQPTHTARAILKFKGVYYKKHLQRGVAKGSLSQEQADLKWQNFIDEKDAKVAARFEETRLKRLERLKELSGTPKAAKVVAVAETKAADGAAGGGDDANKTFAESVEQTTVESFAAGNADAPAAEEPKAEEPKTEAPAVEETKEEAPVAKEPKVEEPAVEEAKVAAPVAEPKAEAPAAEDDYKKIEGIGPKIAELLHGAGLASFADLENAPIDKLKGILAEAGSRYTMHNPATWPQQAGLAAAGKWDELKVLQDELDGGKPPVSNSGEEE